MARERKLATLCPHSTRLEKAKGLCSPCYRANAKAEQIAKNKIKIDEETGLTKTGEAVIPADKDEKAVFKAIMWKWINEHEASAEKKIYDEAGNRDFRTEVRLQDLKAQLAMKGATILSRELITEKKEESKTEELPGQATLNGFMAGWMKASQMSPTPRQRATGEKGDLSDLEDDRDETFDA